MLSSELGTSFTLTLKYKQKPIKKQQTTHPEQPPPPIKPIKPNTIILQNTTSTHNYAQ